MRRGAWLILVVAVGLLSCTEEGRDPDEDAGPTGDAGPRDTGAPRDAGRDDAGRDDDAGAACSTAADCQDGEYCNGAEACAPGTAGAGPDGCAAGAPPCGAATCDETTDTCTGTCDFVPPPECVRDADCTAVRPCAGDETCVDGACVAGSPVLCAAPTTCVEARGATCAVACTTPADCDDGVFCNGRERCVDGGCEPGRPACEGSSRGPLCDEAADTCYCTATTPDCPDDGLHCNGLRYCHTTARECRVLPIDCGLRTCIEARDRCESVCATDADCSSTMPCTRGRCVSGACTTPVSCTFDSDGDGYASFADGGGDCDDTRALISPARTEVCDAMDVDEDCNPTTFGTRDADGDGAVDAVCCNVDAGAGRRCGTDCDDTRSGTHPTSTETCNGYDDDCDASIDEGVLAAFYRDADGDGDGDAACVGSFCSATPGWVPSAGDCDETNESLGAGSSRCAASGDGVEVCTDGAWMPQACGAGTTCRPQPDGSGLCI